MANEKILAAFKCVHDDGDLLVVVGATTAKEFRAAVVDAELVRMHAHEEGAEHDQPLHAFAAWRFDEKDKRHLWDLDVEKDTPGARPAMVANAYWAEACEFAGGQMHAQLLSMLGAKTHEEAGGIIGRLKARELVEERQGVPPSLIREIEGIALTFADAYEAAARETYREDVEKKARKAKQELTAALQSALATNPTQQGPLHGDYASDLKKEGPLIITLENVNDGKQWCATTNHYDFIVIGQNSAQDALSLALKRACATPQPVSDAPTLTTQQGLDDRNVFERAYAQHAINYAGLDAPVEQIIQRIKDGRDGNRYAHMHDAGAWVGWNLAIAAQAKQGGAAS